MKKTITILIVTIISFSTLYSCNKEKYKSPCVKATEMQTEIMKCFENEDKETLKSFFSKYATDNYDLDSQIDEAFDFIDGKIVSYDEPFPRAVGSFDRKGYGADTNNIKTDKGTEYIIRFNGWVTNNENADEIGVTQIGIHNETLQKNATQKEIDENPTKYDIYIGGRD